MANGRHGLAGVEEGLHESHRLGLQVQCIGIHDPSGQQQRVIVLRVRAAEHPVDREVAAPLGVIPALDLTAPGRDDFGSRSGSSKGLARFGQFRLLKPVSGENRDA